MTGTTPAAWNDPAKGGELAKSQFDRGADVVYAAAGGTGVGVYQAAKDAGKLAIGVDSNQNHLHPGHDADLDGQARRRRRVRRVQATARRTAGPAACRRSAWPRGASPGRSTSTTRSSSRPRPRRSSKNCRRASSRRDRGARLHVGQQLPRLLAGIRSPGISMTAAGSEAGCPARRHRAGRHREALRRGPRQPGRQPGRRGGHRARHRRRERRRQVDAHEHPVRLLPGRRWRA